MISDIRLYHKSKPSWRGTVRMRVVGPLALDYFAENLIDALKHNGHIVANLGMVGPRHRSRLLETSRMLARRIARIREPVSCPR